MSAKPNILLITSHDLGRHLGCYGQRTVTSPNIDRLAAEGLLFANHFCAAPQCSPSRAAIATGRFPHANGVMGLTHRNFAWDLYPSEKHIAQVLAGAGYRTAGMGVLHDSRDPGRRSFQFCPGSRGDAGEPADVLAGQAVEYLETASNEGNPFFLQVGFFEPHRPFDFGDCPPDEEKGVAIPSFLLEEESARVEFAGFQGAVRQLDRGVGRILRALEETGLAEETLVIFTADHGIPFPRAKCSVYDPGLEAALVVRWPGGEWKGGRVFEELLSNVDLFPTILETLSLPLSGNLHGRSFAALCEGRTYEARDEIFAEFTYHHYFDPRRVVRTNTHKLILNFAPSPEFMEPSQTFRPGTKPVHPPDPSRAFQPPLEFYDLTVDPGETRNLAEDPRVAELRGKLLAKLRDWLEATGDPILKGPIACPQHHVATRLLTSGH